MDTIILTGPDGDEANNYDDSNKEDGQPDLLSRNILMAAVAEASTAYDQDSIYLQSFQDKQAMKDFCMAFLLDLVAIVW